MSWLIDLLAIVGGGVLTAGVYLEFGLSYALIASGSMLIALAIKAAKVHEVIDAPE